MAKPGDFGMDNHLSAIGVEVEDLVEEIAVNAVNLHAIETGAIRQSE